MILLVCHPLLLRSQSSDNAKLALDTANGKLSYERSTTSLAQYILATSTTEDQKVRAIYRWVTSNITYSTDSINQINLGANSFAKITEAFRRRKGVCENYSAIFNDLCSKCGISSFVIDGFTKQSGHPDQVGHTWCAMRVDGRWGLCDPTWDSGAGDNTNYYLISPDEFIETHMPFDPIWQMLEKPLSYQEFFGKASYTRNNKWNYTDSINSFLALDSLERLKASLSRIQKNGNYTPLINNREKLLKMHLEIIYQDKDTFLYKLAASNLNAATNIYNRFVKYRNEQFKPATTDADLEAMITSAESKIKTGLQYLEELNTSKATLTFDTDQIRTQAQNLLFKIKQQEDFVAKYLNTEFSKRIDLFYK